jgi:stage IV sporulation protein A
VTTDGTITDIPREDYVEAEKRVVEELKAINKPFVIVLNSVIPGEQETQNLRQELEEKYEVPVISVNCAQMRTNDIACIMERILYEFPISEIGINIPKWVETLEQGHWLRVDMLQSIRDTFAGVQKIREARDAIERFYDYDFIMDTDLSEINPGRGNMLLNIKTPDNLFYDILSDTTGLRIDGEHKLIGLIKNLAGIKKEYERVEFALHEVRVKGYGVVTPQMEEMTLDEPEIIKQGNRFGVKLRASAPSVHMIRADIETEIAPLVGTEKQSEELVNYLLKEFEGEPGKIWESNIFGKSLHELVSEGLHNKLNKMPEDAQIKLQETLQRIINEGSGGLICIIL